MIYQFSVVPALPSNEPSQSYFESLRKKALEVLAAAKLSDCDVLCHSHLAEHQIWHLCEYMDSVDAGDIPMCRQLYAQCVSMTSGFLYGQLNEEAVELLAAKSWAANTLLTMLREPHHVTMLVA